MSHQPDNIPAGTQVVSSVPIRGTNGALVHPRGAVGINTRTPTGEENLYLVRFPDGFALSLHYLGFAETQWRLFSKEESPRVKPLLYTYRVLLTGIHLMRSGEIEANLLTLNEDFRLPFLGELIEQKLNGPEKASISGADISFHEVEVNRIRQELEAAYSTSRLPELPSEQTRAQLSKLLVRLRMNPTAKSGK